MKVRNGFVSNSSTSSFCIYGAVINGGDITIDSLRRLKKFKPERWQNICSKRTEYYGKIADTWAKNLTHVWTLLTNIDSITPEEATIVVDAVAGDFSSYIYMEYLMGISYHHGPESELYVGESWRSIGDDETGKQFKQRISDEINAVFPGTECGTYEEAWRDG